MISRWALGQIVKKAVNSMPFDEGEDRSKRADRIAQEIGVSRATLYNWANMKATQTPSIDELWRLLSLCRPKVRAWAISELSKYLGVKCEIELHAEVADHTEPMF